MSENQPPPNPNRMMAAAVMLVVGILVCGGAIPAVGVVAAIAIPNFVTMQLKAKRSEVPGNVDGIKTAEIAYHAAFDRYVPVDPAPRAARNVNKEAVSWQGTPAWKELGWSPDGNVRGVYWVEVTPEGFTVHGVCDVDADGEPAEYTATAERNATLETGSMVF